MRTCSVMMCESCPWLWATWVHVESINSDQLLFYGSVIKMEYTICRSFSSKTPPTKLLGFWTTTSTGYLDVLSVFLLAKHLKVVSSCGIGGSSKQVILYEILPHWKHFSPVNHRETERVQGSSVCFCYSSSQAWNLCSSAVENDNKSHDTDAWKKQIWLHVLKELFFSPGNLMWLSLLNIWLTPLYYNNNTIFNNRETVHHIRYLNMSKAVQNKM